MSRSTSLSDLLAAADVPGWWMSSSGGDQVMRTLRQAIAEERAKQSGRPMSLFRPGGFGQAAIWLDADAINRLDELLKRPGANAA
jgi:hypothetical protein